MARMWTVTYKEATRVAHATERLQAAGEVVQCGMLGALWRVAGLEHYEDGSLTVELWPMNAHDVDPRVAAVELPLPEDVL